MSNFLSRVGKSIWPSTEQAPTWSFAMDVDETTDTPPTKNGQAPAKRSNPGDDDLEIVAVRPLEQKKTSVLAAAKHHTYSAMSSGPRTSDPGFGTRAGDQATMSGKKRELPPTQPNAKKDDQDAKRRRVDNGPGGGGQQPDMAKWWSDLHSEVKKDRTAKSTDRNKASPSESGQKIIPPRAGMGGGGRSGMGPPGQSYASPGSTPGSAGRLTMGPPGQLQASPGSLSRPVSPPRSASGSTSRSTMGPPGHSKASPSSRSQPASPPRSTMGSASRPSNVPARAPSSAIGNLTHGSKAIPHAANPQTSRHHTSAAKAPPSNGNTASPARQQAHRVAKPPTTSSSPMSRQNTTKLAPPPTPPLSRPTVQQSKAVPPKATSTATPALGTRSRPCFIDEDSDDDMDAGRPTIEPPLIQPDVKTEDVKGERQPSQTIAVPYHTPAPDIAQRAALQARSDRLRQETIRRRAAPTAERTSPAASNASASSLFIEQPLRGSGVLKQQQGRVPALETTDGRLGTVVKPHRGPGQPAGAGKDALQGRNQPRADVSGSMAALRAKQDRERLHQQRMAAEAGEEAEAFRQAQTAKDDQQRLKREAMHKNRRVLDAADEANARRQLEIKQRQARDEWEARQKADKDVLERRRRAQEQARIEAQAKNETMAKLLAVPTQRPAPAPTSEPVQASPPSNPATKSQEELARAERIRLMKETNERHRRAELEAQQQEALQVEPAAPAMVNGPVSLNSPAGVARLRDQKRSQAPFSGTSERNPHGRALGEVVAEDIYLLRRHDFGVPWPDLTGQFNRRFDKTLAVGTLQKRYRQVKEAVTAGGSVITAEMLQLVEGGNRESTRDLNRLLGCQAAKAPVLDRRDTEEIGNISTGVSPRKNRNQEICEIRPEDVWLMRQRDGGLDWPDLVTGMSQRFGRKNVVKTLQERYRHVKGAFATVAVHVASGMLDSVENGDIKAKEQLNRLVFPWQPPRNASGQFLTAPKREGDSARQVAAQSIETAFRNARGHSPPEVDDDQLEDRPTHGGKSINDTTFLYYAGIQHDLYEQHEAERLREREPSPLTAEDRCHFVYQVQRREISGDELGEDDEDEDNTIESKEWILCEDDYDDKDLANLAAGVQVTRFFDHRNAKYDLLKGNSITNEYDELGMQWSTLTLTGGAMVQARVSRQVRSVHEGVFPTHKDGWLPVHVWIVQQRVVTKSGNDDLFEPSKETDVTSYPSNELFTSLEQANQSAAKLFVSLTFTSESRNLRQRDREVKDAEERLFGAFDPEEGERFERDVEADDGRTWVKVCVESGHVVGPRN